MSVVWFILAVVGFWFLGLIILFTVTIDSFVDRKPWARWALTSLLWLFAPILAAFLGKVLWI